jgi:mutator protein MutT
MKTIVVVAGVIERDRKLLITRRLKDTHLAGLWEFPGGKCEPDETHEHCLEREVDEELGVDVRVGSQILVVEHTYDDRRVRLHFLWCTIEGEPQAKLGQEMRWVDRQELRDYEFPAADKELIRELTTSRP